MHLYSFQIKIYSTNKLVHFWNLFEFNGDPITLKIYENN